MIITFLFYYALRTENKVYSTTLKNFRPTIYAVTSVRSNEIKITEAKQVLLTYILLITTGAANIYWKFLLTKKKRRFVSNNNSIRDSAMTFTLDLKNWLKVTAHSFPKCTLWGWTISKIKPRGEKVCSGQLISDGQTDGRTERRTDILIPKALRAPVLIKTMKYICYVALFFSIFEWLTK